MERFRQQLTQRPGMFVEQYMGTSTAPFELSDDDTGPSRPQPVSKPALNNIVRPLHQDKANYAGAKQFGATASQYYKAPSQPVSKPSSQPVPGNLRSTQDDDTAEVLNLGNIPVTGYELRKSADETQKELKELFEGAINDDPDVDMTMAEVEGFAKGVKLLPHQVQGRVWMTMRESGKKNGGILGDDMGLGKTYQTICRIVDSKNDDDPIKVEEKKKFSKTTLVVGPNSVLAQWESEIQKVAPSLRVLIHRSASRTKDASKLKTYDVVITSFNMVQKEYENHTGATPSKDSAEDSDEDSDSAFVAKAKKNMAKKKPVAKKHSALFDMQWLRVVLDEAHNIKNRASKTAKACFNLKAKYRWCLTGTPIQNNVEELFSLLHFLNIRPLNDWNNFQTHISRPIKDGKTAVPMKRLHAVLSAIMLRRTKTQVVNGKPILALPDRTVQLLDCEFDEEEDEFYKALQERTDASLTKLSNGKEATYTSVLVLLLRMRQACCHPALCMKKSKDDAEAIDPKAAVKPSQENIEAPPVDDEADDLADMLGRMGVENKCEICQDRLPPSHKGQYCADCELQVVVKARRKSEFGASSGGTRVATSQVPSSAKIRKLLEILEKIDADSKGTEKTIVFSQFVSLLNLIEPFLRERYFKHVRYDGQMKMDDRENALNRFRNDDTVKIILISFKAGSTGLNLTAANHVVLMDLWWNPALEDQAFDRAHRFGQKKEVFIYKLVVPNTVEQRIQELQEKKRELASAALTGGKLGTGNLRLGMDDLLSLFTHSG